MKQVRIILPLAVLIVSMAALRQATTSAASASAPQAQPSAPTIASALDHEISGVESRLWTLPKPCRKTNTTSRRRR